MTTQQRSNLMNQLSRRRRAAAKAQGVNTTGADSSAPVAVEQHAESSAVAESRGPIGGEFVLYDPVLTATDSSTPVAVEQHAESSAMAKSRGAIGGGFVSYEPVSTSAETNLDWQNEGRTELVSGSEEMMHYASANEEGRSTASLPDLTYGAQEIDPVLAAFNNLPGSVASTSFLARVARQRLHYGDPADMMVASVPTSSNVLSIPPQEHQQPATPSPTPTEMSDSFSVEENATPTYSYPSPPGAYHTVPYPIVLRGLLNAPHSSPAPSDQTGTNIDDLPSSPLPLQFPVDAPSSPQILIDPALLQLDALVSNAVDQMESIQEAEQTLRDMGVWPESPKRSN
ncbi:hypothetical protein MMC22_000975 [Lobaria immixta]|nr:hypothetical protein [Lobaria immixta]